MVRVASDRGRGGPWAVEDRAGGLGHGPCGLVAVARVMPRTQVGMGMGLVAG